MIDNQNLILSEIKNKIYTIREVQVMLDSDLAILYHVEIKQFNRSIKRNIDRFPEDFCFQLTNLEYKEILRCQFGTLKIPQGKHRKYLPYVFTEHGISMLSSILNSKEAISINIQIIRAFILMRNIIKSNEFIINRVENIEQKLVLHDSKFNKIFNLLEYSETKKN